MNIEPMTDGLVRQRRNLISTSCLLVFLKFAGVEISKFSFLGIDFGNLGNPSALYLAIWISFVYFLFRYYQYFSQEGRPRLSRYFYEEMERRVMRRAKEMANEISKGSTIHPHQLISLQRANWVFTVTSNNGSDGSGGWKSETKEMIFPAKERTKYKISSLKNISVHTSAVTDYILPLIIALGATIYCLQGAPSSLVEAIKNGFS